MYLSNMTSYNFLYYQRLDYQTAFQSGFQWDDLRKVIINWEEYILNYSISPHVKALRELLNITLKLYIIGGNKLDNFFTEESDFNKKIFNKEVLESYNLFIELNNNSEFFPIIYKYLEFIHENNNLCDYIKNLKFYNETVQNTEFHSQ